MLIASKTLKRMTGSVQTTRNSVQAMKTEGLNSSVYRDLHHLQGSKVADKNQTQNLTENCRAAK